SGPADVPLVGFETPSDTQKRLTIAKAAMQLVVEIPASPAIAGKSAAHDDGGTGSWTGSGCVARVSNVALSAERTCPASGGPRSMRITRSTRSLVRVLSRPDHGKE